MFSVLARRFRSKIARFPSAASGNVLMLFAIAAPTVMLGVGAAVDFSRGADAQVKIQTALDAAVLAGAKMLAEGGRSEGDIKQAAADIFAANIDDANKLFRVAPEPVFEIDDSKNVLIGSAAADMGTLFSSLTSTGGIDVGATSEAGFQSLDVELAMVLDTTLSMSGSKIADLKKAAHGAVDLLIGDKATNVTRNSTRISVVPYAGSVNAGSYAPIVSNGASADCITERTGRLAASDNSPKSSALPFDTRAKCPSAAILPLTDNQSDIMRTIGDLDADGITAGHIGVAWGYYALSPDWSGIWPTKSNPTPYRKSNTMKVAVLMTDGEFNTFYDGLKGRSYFRSSSAISRSERQAEDICKAMKDDGIVVYSVAFESPSSAQKLLRKCASSDGKYFEADTGTELVAAFESIAIEIRELRLTR